MGKAVKFELEFIKKQKESKDTYSFYFKRPNEFDFFSGQYVKLFLDILNPDSRGSSRYFTISSSPEEKKYLIITTRIIKSSFKLKLNRLKSGEKIMAFGPVGYFDFYPEKQKNLVFIAGGIGVTPFHSILKTLEFKKSKINIILFNSFDYKQNVVFYRDLKKIENENLNIKLIYTLTKDANNYLEFEKGRIDESLIKKYIDDLHEYHYFITGSENFVNDIFEMLRKIGVLEEKIFKEDFPGY